MAKAFEPSSAVGSDSGQRQSERLSCLRRAPIARLHQPDHLALAARKPPHRRDQCRLDVRHLDGRRRGKPSLLSATGLRQPHPEQIRHRRLHGANSVPVLPGELQRCTHGIGHVLRCQACPVGAAQPWLCFSEEGVEVLASCCHRRHYWSEPSSDAKPLQPIPGNSAGLHQSDHGSPCCR